MFDPDIDIQIQALRDKQALRNKHALRDIQALREAFDNQGVRNATDGCSGRFGYHHGPIPNVNHGWIPDSHRASLDAGKRARRPVTAEENAKAPNKDMRMMSSINGLVCDIEVDPGTGIMCGAVYQDQPNLRRHIRTCHPGALLNPDRRVISLGQLAAGQDPLRHWVLFKGWRNAKYAFEPRFSHRHPSLIRQYADQCETIAAADSTFAEQYGRLFHRKVYTDTYPVGDFPSVHPASRLPRHLITAPSVPPPRSPSADVPPPPSGDACARDLPASVSGTSASVQTETGVAAAKAPASNKRKRTREGGDDAGDDASPAAEGSNNAKKSCGSSQARPLEGQRGQLVEEAVMWWRVWKEGEGSGVAGEEDSNEPK